ncbi:hypothetical protein FBU30_000254 [Linnemannia zychae]|nr:hypothetical protein FBU30_000254 [Linnemannia zychae]
MPLTSDTHDHHVHYYSHYRERSPSYSYASNTNSSSHYYNRQEPSSYYQDPSRGDMPYRYLQRGHRHSTDSAAADTLLMLSAAAFMDPDAIRMVTSTASEAKQHQQQETEGRPHYQAPFAEEQLHLHQHRPQMMAKTVSAPVSSSSSYRRPLPPFTGHPHPRDLVVEETYMDVDVADPCPSSSSSYRLGTTKGSTETQTLVAKDQGSRHHLLPSPASSRFITPTPSNLISSAMTSHTSSSSTTTAALSSVSKITSVKGNSSNASLSHDLTLKETARRSGTNVDPTTTTRLSFTINKEGTGHLVMEEQEDTTDMSMSKEKGRKEEILEGEEDEEEDEVMSEGVVHVNSHLAPIALSPPNKVHLAPLVLPSTLPHQKLHSQQQQQQDLPKTPTSARTPRTPKSQAAGRITPKTPRVTKRSQNENISSPASTTTGIRGKSHSNTRDSSVDYFYSPFPPLANSPSLSPSSPSSFQAQLQRLTHNFVSIQPHASPTSRFRRTPNGGNHHLTHPTSSSSPPASPGQDMMRDSSYQTGSNSTHSSPTKSHGSHSGRSLSGAGGRSSFKPRWHTQPYMMFLALRAMPNRTAARQELIMAAVELDKKFSAEKGLPRVFTGKTPMNSASACLTNNGDKYFIPFKPEGSRSTHFRLAHQPCDFDTAVKDYYGWMEELIRHDWPLCFGTPKNKSAIESSDEKTMTMGSRPGFERTDSDSRKRGPDLDGLEQSRDRSLSPGGENNGANKKIKSTVKDEEKEKGASSSFSLDEISRPNHTSNVINSKANAIGVRKLDLDAAGRLDMNGPNSCPPTPATATALALERGLTLDDSPMIVENIRSSSNGAMARLAAVAAVEDLDLSHVPSSLAEIVEVKESKIPHAGKGLFAKVDLPAGTPLGFYFGVPMTENEFDSLKEGVGAASQYAIMYRRSVLDATDEQGQPFKQGLSLGSSQPHVAGQVQGEELLCPFHYLNEDLDGNVSFITGNAVNQVICTTNRLVHAGDELTVFFAKESERHWPISVLVVTPAALKVPETNVEITSKDEVPTQNQETESGSGSGLTSHSNTDRWNRDSASSGRPRRETVYKPVRYSR